MILDIKGTISVKSPGFSLEVIKSRILEKLSDAHCNCSINQNGDLEWKSAWLSAGKAMIGQLVGKVTFLGTEGRIKFKQNTGGNIDMTFNVSLILMRLYCIMLSLIALLVYVLHWIPLIVLIIFIFYVWILAYGRSYLILRFYIKSFIKRQIHEIG